MKYQIRRARHEDAESIIKVHRSSIHDVCGKDYTSEQITAWADRPDRAGLWQQAIDRDFIWVIEGDDNCIFGFGHLAVMDNENAEVMGLYFIPPVIGLGFGKKMFEKFLSVAHEHRIKRLNLYSTITAKNFYEKIGFFQSGGDTTIEMRGVAIPCFPMSMDLVW